MLPSLSPLGSGHAPSPWAWDPRGILPVAPGHLLCAGEMLGLPFWGRMGSPRGDMGAWECPLAWGGWRSCACFLGALSRVQGRHRCEVRLGKRWCAGRPSEWQWGSPGCLRMVGGVLEGYISPGISAAWVGTEETSLLQSYGLQGRNLFIIIINYYYITIIILFKRQKDLKHRFYLKKTPKLHTSL